MSSDSSTIKRVLSRWSTLQGCHNQVRYYHPDWCLCERILEGENDYYQPEELPPIDHPVWIEAGKTAASYRSHGSYSAVCFINRRISVLTFNPVQENDHFACDLVSLYSMCHHNIKFRDFPTQYGVPTHISYSLPFEFMPVLDKIKNDFFQAHEFLKLFCIAAEPETVSALAQVGLPISADISIPELSRLSNLLEKLIESISGLVSPDVIDVLKARVVALVQCIWNIIRWTMDKLPTLDLVMNLTSSLAILFPSESISKFFLTLFGSTTAQSGIEISAKTALKTVFSCIFLAVTSKLPGKGTLDEYILRVRNIPQCFKSISMFYEMIEPIANECIAFIEEHLLGLDPTLSRLRTVDEVTEFSDRIAHLTELHKRRLICKDPEVASDAGRLHYDHIRLLGKLKNMNYDRTSIDFLQKLLATTYRISNDALASGADMNKMRRKPIVVWLAGQSQVGKTSLILKLIQDVEKHSSPQFKETGSLPDDWQKEIFSCNPENEYMDGYHGQRWVTLDEFNQQRDSIANPSAENFIILRAVGQFPYLLHMAQIHEKPNSYFTSSGMILTSNSTNIQPESIKTKEAITNRIGYAFKQEVKEEYRLYYDNKRKYKLNLEKVKYEFGGYTTDVYYFVRFDPLTQEESPVCYTYEQLLWLLIDAYDNETNCFTSYFDYLDNNRSQALPPRDSSVYTPPTSELNTSSDDEQPKRKSIKKYRAPQPPTERKERKRIPVDYSYLEEWQNPYTPYGESAGCIPTENTRECLLKYKKKTGSKTRLQSGDEVEDSLNFPSWESSCTQSSFREVYKEDYIKTPFYLLPYVFAWHIFASPFAALEKACQKSSFVANCVPKILRRFTADVSAEYHFNPPGYIRAYDHNALLENYCCAQMDWVSPNTSIPGRECEAILQQIVYFKRWAKDRTKLIKQTAKFYLPGTLCTIVSAVISGGLLFTLYKKGSKQVNKFLHPPNKDPKFQPKFKEAEDCFLNGCDCEDCQNVDLQQYESEFIFWNVPCKCFVDYCNKQSIQDQQRFVSVITQLQHPTQINDARAFTQMAKFVRACVCEDCPLCQGEKCLCQGIAKSRGVEIGEDDLLDRVGLYRITKERLEAFAQRKLQSSESGQLRSTRQKTVVRTQQEPPIQIQSSESGQIRKNAIKTRVTTQNEVTTQSVSPKHSTNTKTNKITVQHELPKGSKQEHLTMQGNLWSTSEKNGQELSQSKPLSQFESVSCNCPTPCDCANRMNSAVQNIDWEEHGIDSYMLSHKDVPTFVPRRCASEKAQRLWDEFEGLTYVQGKRKMEEMVARFQANRANDIQAHDILNTRLWPNILRLYVVLPGEPSNSIHRQLGHMLALGGDLFLTNHHFITVLEQYPDADVVIRQGTIEWKRLKASVFTSLVYRIPAKDAVVLKINYKGNAFARVSQHFLSKETTLSHETQSILLARYTLTKQCQMYPNPISTTGARLSSRCVDIELDARSKTIIVQPISWEYECHTNNGDCGAPVMLLNSRIPTKIVGIHNAYSEGIGIAYAVPLYAEEIQKAIEHFGPKSQYGWADLLPVDDLDLLAFEDGENFRVVSVIKGPLPQPTVSKLRRSPIFGNLTDTKTKPGHLKPFYNEKGEKIDPARLARKKWGHHLPTLDPIKVEQCNNLISQLFGRETPRDAVEYFTPLTTEQSIIGVPGVDGLPSMNKQSSPGYPYIFTKPPGRGKTGFFGKFDWQLDTPEAKIILDAVHNMEKSIVDGVRPFVVSVDTLKDARIPCAKADAGKTRIFSAMPVDYCVLHRKYFLPFIAHIMKNRLENWSAPGINATSPEFNHLATLLQSKGPECSDIDYQQYDGFIPTEAILSLYEAACDWYIAHWDLIVQQKKNFIGDKLLEEEEFRTFLMRIALECVNHVHVCEKQNEQGERFQVFYVVMNGQPSGNPGTAVSNTAAGVWILGYCWITETGMTLAQFLAEVYASCYGDDVIMNISSQVSNIYNQHVLSDAMWRNFRLVATDAQKTGDTPPKTRPLSETSFLKRSFKWNSDIHMYVGVLPIDLILDVSNWVRDGAQDPYIITADNLSWIAMELSYHGKEVFDQYMPKVRQAYRKIAHRAGKLVFFDSYWSYIFRYRDGATSSAFPV
jgi:hypothetical protein